MGEKAANSRKRILLVDDDPMVRAVLRESLHALGHAVVAAENGRKAFDIFQRMRSSICLLITDIRMPVMDGVSLVQRIRELDAQMPIAVMTAYADEPQLAAIEQQLTTLFTKPVTLSDLESLLATIRRG